MTNINHIIQAAQAMANTQMAQGINMNQVIQTVQQFVNNATNPNKGKTFNMTPADVEKLVSDRLTKLNLKLGSFKYENAWDKITDYQAVKLEDIPKCKKQFCYIRDIFHGENILGLSIDPQKPCMMAAKLDDVESEFMREGNIQASSTYIKIPLAFHLIDERILSGWENTCCTVDYIICSTPDEINAWFDKFEEYLPRLIKQGERCAEVYDFIKTNGKPYKATMKQYSKRDKEWKEARKSYEEMILKQIKRITKLDELEEDF